jgi:bifunctional DNA-binding transcriptional regulator/antitoxin component of YhaV-PrlF toxin-antitoxin module
MFEVAQLLPAYPANGSAPLAGGPSLPYIHPMLAKLTAKNQLTLPKRALDELGTSAAPTYFEVEVKDGRIVLTPARLGSADAVRRKLAELGINDTEVANAVTWARQPPKRRLRKQ